MQIGVDVHTVSIRADFGCTVVAVVLLCRTFHIVITIVVAVTVRFFDTVVIAVVVRSSVVVVRALRRHVRLTGRTVMNRSSTSLESEVRVLLPPVGNIDPLVVVQILSDRLPVILEETDVGLDFSFRCRHCPRFRDDLLFRLKLAVVVPEVRANRPVV